MASRSVISFVVARDTRKLQAANSWKVYTNNIGNGGLGTRSILGTRNLRSRQNYERGSAALLIVLSARTACLFTRCKSNTLSALVRRCVVTNSRTRAAININ